MAPPKTTANPVNMKALYKAKKARKDDFYPTLLIALDNDDAGNRAINMLTTQLTMLE